MADVGPIELSAVGFVESYLRELSAAPRQTDEGAPAAVVRLLPEVAEAAADLAVGDEVVLVTWLHRARRDVVATHPRDDRSRPRSGVFSTRSPDRPNPIGLHRVRITGVSGLRIELDGLEAIDGTPVLDIKPVLSARPDR